MFQPPPPSNRWRRHYFRFGSTADISQCNRHIRFTPESDIRRGVTGPPIETAFYNSGELLIFA
jgi:hypothetical protein